MSFYPTSLGRPLSSCWTLAKNKKTKAKNKALPRSDGHAFPSTLFYQLYFSVHSEDRLTNQGNFQLVRSFRMAGRLLIIQNPLWGVLRNLAAQKVPSKVIQSLKPPSDLRRIQDSGVCMTRWSCEYTYVVLGAALTGFCLGLGPTSCTKWGCQGFWPAPSHVSLGLILMVRMSPLPSFLPNKHPSQSRTWLERTFHITRESFSGKRRNYLSN